MVRTAVISVNEKLEEYAGDNAYLKYLCYNYVKIDIETVCNETTPFYEQEYVKFVCRAYQAGP